MKLVRVELFKFGAIREWHHSERGRIDTVTTWLGPGATVITLRLYHSKAAHARRAELRRQRCALGHVADVVPLPIRKTA